VIKQGVKALKIFPKRRHFQEVATAASDIEPAKSVAKRE